MSQAGPVSQNKAPGSAATTISPVVVYLDANGDFRLSTTETADRIIVADGNDDHRLAASGTVAAQLAKIGTDILRIEV